MKAHDQVDYRPDLFELDYHRRRRMHLHQFSLYDYHTTKDAVTTPDRRMRTHLCIRFRCSLDLVKSMRPVFEMRHSVSKCRMKIGNDD